MLKSRMASRPSEPFGRNRFQSVRTGFIWSHGLEGEGFYARGQQAGQIETEENARIPTTHDLIFRILIQHSHVTVLTWSGI